MSSKRVEEYSKQVEELREVATKRMELQAKLIDVHAWQTCLNCLYWQGNMGMPGQCEKFKATPPLHIVVSGCPDHENDIPF